MKMNRFVKCKTIDVFLACDLEGLVKTNNINSDT